MNMFFQYAGSPGSPYSYRFLGPVGGWIGYHDGHWHRLLCPFHDYILWTTFGCGAARLFITS